MSGSVFAVVYLIFQIIGIAFAFIAIKKSRTPQGSLAWVVFLISAPLIAVPAYLFLGNWKFRGYMVARRESEQVIHGIQDQKAKFGLADDHATVDMAVFEKLSGFDVVVGNNMEILAEGEQFFETLFDAFRNAKSYALVQSYIIRDDELGMRYQAEMIDMVKRGVKVWLMYDAVGCKDLPSSYIETLRDAGVKVMNVHAKRGPSNRFQINFRNHRKTTVVDGEIGFTGGFNVGDEYLGKDPKYGNHWRDTHCRLHGPIVTQQQLVYAEDWYWASDEALLEELNWEAHRAPENMNGIFLPTGPADELETGSLYFCEMIKRAKQRVWIASPYFVPENDVLSALKLAALRGVDVRILTPEVADHFLTWYAAKDYFDEMIDVGVQIWYYKGGFMHSKYIVVDENISSIGTINLDNRSCRLNFETTAILFDKRAAVATAAMFEADVENSYLYTDKLEDRPLKERIFAPISRLFAPLL